jgi:hypothetical protein
LQTALFLYRQWRMGEWRVEPGSEESWFIGDNSRWFQRTLGRDIQRAMERVELVLSQEELDRIDLEGKTYPIDIISGLNLKGRPDFRINPAGVNNDLFNHEGCGCTMEYH